MEHNNYIFKEIFSDLLLHVAGVHFSKVSSIKLLISTLAFTESFTKIYNETRILFSL